MLYIYRWRCKGEIPHLHRGFEYLKYYIKIGGKTPPFIYPSNKKSKLIKKGLNVEGEMNGWLSFDTYYLFLYFKLFVWKQNIFLYILFCVFFIYSVGIELHFYNIFLFLK